jgi:hypothetical protein
MFLPQVKRPIFTPIKTTGKTEVLLFYLHTVDNKMGEKILEQTVEYISGVKSAFNFFINAILLALFLNT